jgi:hypothetical protein
MFDGSLVDTWSVMRYDVHPPDLSEVETVGEEDLSFAAFSLAHAACGDDVLEVRLGEKALLEWCMACDVMRIFGPRVV